MKAESRSKIFALVPAAKDAAQPAGPKVYKFRANDGDYDRYNDRLSVSGWKLDAFRVNPIILFNHDAGTGGLLGLGPKTLPIGRGEVAIDGDKALMVGIVFDQADPFAKQIESKVEQGILNAVSVRYLIPEGKYVENEKGGLDSSEQELLEISVVTIPGNQRAVRVKDLEGDQRALVDEFADLIAMKVLAQIDERDARVTESAKKALVKIPQFNPNEFAKAFAAAMLAERQ